MDKKKKKLKKFFRDNLNNKNRAGYGRPKNKGVHNETPYIHANNTFKTYLSQCYHFADWCYERGIKYPEEAYGKVHEYGKWMEDRGLSAWTVYKNFVVTSWPLMIMENCSCFISRARVEK